MLHALCWMRRWLRGAQVCLAEAMGLDGSTQRIVTGLTFCSRRRRPCLCLACASVRAGCGVRAASHLAAGSFLHSSHRYVLSSSSGLMRRLQDLQGDVRPFLLRVMNWRPDVFMSHFPRNCIDHERDGPGCGVVNVLFHQDPVRALAAEVKGPEKQCRETFHGPCTRYLQCAGWEGVPEPESARP